MRNMVKIPRPLLYTMSVAVIIRLVVLLLVLWIGAGESILGYGDAGGYLELATNMAQGNGYVSKNDITGIVAPEVFRSPGLPVLLVPFTLVPHGLIVWAVVFSIITGILLPFITYSITDRLFGKKPAMIAAVLVAVEPHLIWFSWLPLSEMPFILFSLAGFLLVLHAWEKKSYPLFFVSGILLGYAVLIRPPFLAIFGLLLVIAAAWLLFKRVDVKRILIIAAGMALLLIPWSARNWVHSGSFSVSGMGWSNVYLDYLASLRAVDNATPFYIEKKNLEMNPPSGISPADVQNPASSAKLREAVLSEFWQRRGTVLSVQTASLLSFFTNDSYYYYLRRFGLVEEKARPEGGTGSVTYAFLTKGLGGISHAVAELERQYFIPLFGRLFTGGILVLAVIGVWYERRKPMTWVLAAIIAAVGLLSTGAGLAVEVRYRVPVEPFIFMLAGVAVYRLISACQIWYAKKRAAHVPTVHSDV